MPDMTKHLRKNETGQPTFNGGEFASKPRTEADTELGTRPPLTDLVSGFLLGSVNDLNPKQVEAIAALAPHMGVKPSVSVQDANSVQLVYAQPGDVIDAFTVRLTIAEEGQVVSAGSGEFWEENDRDDPTLERLSRLGFTS